LVSAEVARFLASLLGGAVSPLVLVVLARRMARRLDDHLLELDERFDGAWGGILKRLTPCAEWRTKQIDALVRMHGAFCDYLDGLRKRFYLGFGPHDRDSTHARQFDERVRSLCILLDDETSERIDRSLRVLVTFGEWASERSYSKAGRAEVRQRLEEELPRYIERIRDEIHLCLGIRDPLRPEAAEPPDDPQMN